VSHDRKELVDTGPRKCKTLIVGDQLFDARTSLSVQRQLLAVRVDEDDGVQTVIQDVFRNGFATNEISTVVFIWVPMLY